MASLDIGDRVIVLSALDAQGNSKGGWAGNGKGRILDYSPARPYFTGGPATEPNKPPMGPAILVLIDQGDESRPANKKFDIWVRPSAQEIVPDPDFAAA